MEFFRIPSRIFLKNLLTLSVTVMTPELKRACELVFQEHRASPIPVNWNKDAFTGRLSFGLSAMAQEILIKKNIIYAPNPGKKLITVLNPAVAGASTLEEAEMLIQNKVIPMGVSESIHLPYEKDIPVFESNAVNNLVALRIAGEPAPITSNMSKTKWYTSALFYYFIWPLCAAVAGAVITWAISTVSVSLSY